MSPSSGTGWATSAWTRQTSTHKPTWRRNDRPSKRLMVCCGRRPHPVGSGMPICWHGSTPSEPVAHEQGDIAPTCQWPVRRNYGEQEPSWALSCKHCRRFAAHNQMLRITESLCVREPCVSRGVHTRDNVTETVSFGTGRALAIACTSCTWHSLLCTLMIYWRENGVIR